MPSRDARARWSAVASLWWREAVVPRWHVLRHLPAAGKPLLLGLLACNLLLGLLPVTFVVLMSILVGRVPDAFSAGLGSPEWHSMLGLFLAGAASFVAQQLVAPLQHSMGELMQRRVDGHVRNHLLSAALRSSGIAPMEDPETLDTLELAMNRLDGEDYSPGMACAGMLALIARHLQLLGFVVLVGTVAAWPVAGLLLAATMTFRYGQRGGLRKYSRVWTEIAPLLRRGAYLRELATGAEAAREIRVFGLDRWLEARYDHAGRTWLSPVWRARRHIYLTPYLIYTAIGLVAAVLVLVLLASRAAAGDATLTGLALGLQATVAALLLGDHYPEADTRTQFGMLAATAMRAFERRIDAADRQLPTLSSRVAPASRTTGPVSFRRVSFQYPRSDRVVLADLDLDLAPGRCTALVGLNGAGKTTLVKLLARLYDPTSGVIYLGDTDIRSLDLAEWRRMLSVVFQDFVKYELSAADSIALGATHMPRDDEAVRQAAQRAGILDLFAHLPLGLDTPVARGYKHGIGLSGGQWQRMAIARSLYAVEAGARVLVLDEPTAALDVRAEVDFFDQFVELTQGVTSLLISHRFSSVRQADEIVVLDGGRITERGTHEGLLAADGTYATLFRLQAERFAAGSRAAGDGNSAGT